MIATDGTPTITSPVTGKDINSRRRYLARRRAEKIARVRAAMHRKHEMEDSRHG